jgi:phage/plasmid-like protein (TIGR03299 family)
MAHEIETHGGKAMFASANVQAWHRLGTVLDHTMTAQEAMDVAFLGGWNVRKEAIVTASGLAVPGRAATVRTNPLTGQDEVLGDVGHNYHIIQNEQHAEFLNILVDESGAHFETVGYAGGKVFLTMKLPGHMAVGGKGGDQVDMYISAINGHDGGTPFTLAVTPVRMVCANTIRFGLAQAQSVFKIRHSSGAEKAIRQEARQKLDLTFNYLDTFQEEANHLVDTALTQVRFEEIIVREFGAPKDAAQATRTRADRKLDEMSRLFSQADTQANIRDTAWAGFNALTEWYDHLSPVRGDDPETSRALNAALYSDKWKTKAYRIMAGV